MERKVELKKQFNSVNGIVSVIQYDPNAVTDELPAALYSVRFSMMSGFYLQNEQTHTLPEKIYGVEEKRADMIINTYRTREKSTGVALIGEKGQGKTLQTTIVTNKLLAAGIPVVLVNDGFSGTEFNTFINLLGNVAIIFDEFAKLYNNNKENQNALLTLFDGTLSQKRLIMITENNEHHINEFLRERPGRLYYLFRYGKINVDIVEEYCADAKVPADKVKIIVDYAINVSGMSMDALQAIVEETLRYPDDSVQDIIKRLNVREVRSSTKRKFKLKSFKQIDKDGIRNVNVVNDLVKYEYFDSDEGDDGEWRATSITLIPEHAKAVKGDLYMYETGVGIFIGTWEYEYIGHIYDF